VESPWLTPHPHQHPHAHQRAMTKDDWGQFSANSDGEESDREKQESVRPAANQFASSRFGIAGGCVCAYRKPLLPHGCSTTVCSASVVEKVASRKRLSRDDDASFAAKHAAERTASSTTIGQISQSSSGGTLATTTTTTTTTTTWEGAGPLVFFGAAAPELPEKTSATTTTTNGTSSAASSLTAVERTPPQQRRELSAASELSEFRFNRRGFGGEHQQQERGRPRRRRRSVERQQSFGKNPGDDAAYDDDDDLDDDDRDEDLDDDDDDDEEDLEASSLVSSSRGRFFGDRQGQTIEARVRKRRDDFCGEGRGKSTAWDVERWHVYAPGSASKNTNVNPDRDDVVLTPAFAPRVATRFFSKSDSTRGLTVSFAMGSIRVVSTAFDRYAQYELVVRVDGRRPTSTWRRYSAFRALVASVAADSAPRQIVRTLSAWADAQDAKRIFRCTHPAYLIQRYYHFEHVLREALFELARPSLLLAFFAPDPDEDPRPQFLGLRQHHVDDRRWGDDDDDDFFAVVATTETTTNPGSSETESSLSSSSYYRLQRPKAERRWKDREDNPTTKPRPRRRGGKARHHSTPPVLAASRPIDVAAADDDPAPPNVEEKHQDTPLPPNPLLAALLGVKDVSRRPNDDNAF